jgi:hypothetical protein
LCWNYDDMQVAMSKTRARSNTGGRKPGIEDAGSPETPSARRLKRLETDAYLSDLGPEF